MALTLAEAYVRLRPDTSHLPDDLRAGTEGPALRAGESAGHRFGSAMAGAIKKALAAIAIGAIALGGAGAKFLTGAVAAASDLNETVSKSQNIFPKTQAIINSFGATAATALGLSKQEALEGAASFGNFFNQIGIGEKQAATMSTRLIKLSADLGSFNNAAPQDVMAAFLSATRGEYDALQKFIPTINAATVQAEALRLSHKKNAKDLTDAEKAQALYNIAFRDAGKAQGDFARTSDGLANQQRILKANFADLRAEIGTALLPVVTSIVTQLNTRLVPALQEVWAKHGPQVIAWLQRAANQIGPLIDKLRDLDWQRFGEQAQNALGRLGPALKSLRESGSDTWADTFRVGGIVLGFLADHADLLAKALPYVIAGLIAARAAQAAHNVAMAAGIPIDLIKAIGQFRMRSALTAHTAALVANTAAIRLTTASEASEVVVQNAGILARTRAIASMVAHRVASIAARAATIAWTAVQWLLNAALTANPIGLIIVAIAALVAVVILAYKHSSTFRAIVQGAWKGIKIAVEATVRWFEAVAWPILKKIFAFIGDAVVFLVGLWTGEWRLISSIVAAVFHFVVDHVRQRIAQIVGFVRGVIAIVAVIRGAFESARAAVVDRIEAVVGFVRALPGRILGVLADLRSRMLGAGRDIIQGLIDGVQQMIGKLVDSVRGVLSHIPSAAKKLLGIESPSRVFREIGQQTILGYVRGLTDLTPGLTDTLGSVVAGLRTAAVAPTGGGGGGITVNVAPAPNMSVPELVAAVRRELAWEASI